jgi:perosamine synthetase
MSFRIPLSAPDVTQVEIDAVTTVLRTPHLSLGPQLSAFEAELAAYHGMPHAIAVSSGTAGLHIALLTLGIRPGDEVIVPSFAFIAVANAVLQVGAIPVFADIDPVTLNLDPTCVAEVITNRTRAIIVVHTFGIPAQMDLLRNLATEYNLVILEDACEAIGATFQGRPVGSFGDLSVFGFYPNKQMTTGEGGAVLARSNAHAARLRSLRNQGRAGTEWLDHAEPGYNYRLSDLACTLGRVQLGRLNEMLALRNAAAERYLALLAGIPCLELPPARLPDRTITWFVFVVRMRDEQTRNRAQSALAARSIATGRYFAPIHLQPSWKNHPHAGISLPLTEAIAPCTLALPLFNRITEQQQDEIANTLAEILIPC